LTYERRGAILNAVEKKLNRKGGGKRMPHSYDYRKLRGRIKEKFGTQAEFSKRLGISEVSVSNKLNNVVDWGQEEMEHAISVLDIPESDIHAYFFTHIVEKSSTV
jgi:hypothetical protein